MFASYPKASRPIATLPRHMAIVSANAALTSAGIGAFQAPSISNWFSALTAAGLGDFQATISAQMSASLSAVGTGAVAPVMSAQMLADANFAGSGAFGGLYTGAAAALMAGSSSFAAVGYMFFADAERACLHQELRASKVEFEYRVFRVPGEDRSEEPPLVVLPEARTAIVPFEDRVYHVAGEARGAGNDPRKRIC